MKEYMIFVEIRKTVSVRLPEPDEKIWKEPDNDDSNEVTKEARDRAINAIISAIPQYSNVFIDGEENEPAELSLDIGEDDIGDVYCEYRP